MRKEFELDPAKNPNVRIWTNTNSGNLYLVNSDNTKTVTAWDHYCIPINKYNILGQLTVATGSQGHRIVRYSELTEEEKLKFKDQARLDIYNMFEQYYSPKTSTRSAFAS